MANLIGESTQNEVAAVKGENMGSEDGIAGVSKTGIGAHGKSTRGRKPWLRGASVNNPSPAAFISLIISKEG